MKEAFKRRSTIVIYIGFVLYVILMFIPSGTFYTDTGTIIFNLFEVSAVMYKYYAVPILIGLAEFICAIANKKPVYVLSGIQMAVSIIVYALSVYVSTYAKNEVEGDFNFNIVYYLPIVASILLFAGGIMFKKEYEKNKLEGGAQQ